MTSRWQRRGRRPWAAARGMTLIEIMIVVIIMALIATGVAVAVVPALTRAREDATVTDMRAVRNAAVLYMTRNFECPSSVDVLVESRDLDSGNRTTDAWGSEFTIQCDEHNDPVVYSAGPDRQMGTADDLSTAQSNEGGD